MRKRKRMSSQYLRIPNCSLCKTHDLYFTTSMLFIPCEDRIPKKNEYSETHEYFYLPRNLPCSYNRFVLNRFQKDIGLDVLHQAKSRKQNAI